MTKLILNYDKLLDKNVNYFEMIAKKHPNAVYTLETAAYIYKLKKRSSIFFCKIYQFRECTQNKAYFHYL